MESGKYDQSPLEVIEQFPSVAEDECADVEDVKYFLKRFLSLEDMEYFQKHIERKAFPEDAPTVGIIGSGPAGLGAAQDLCLMGIKPVIYEMEPVPAGMLYLGVPEYRIPRSLIKAEVEVIKALGTEIGLYRGAERQWFSMPLSRLKVQSAG